MNLLSFTYSSSIGGRDEVASSLCGELSKAETLARRCVGVYSDCARPPVRENVKVSEKFLCICARNLRLFIVVQLLLGTAHSKR